MSYLDKSLLRTDELDRKTKAELEAEGLVAVYSPQHRQEFATPLAEYTSVNTNPTSGRIPENENGAFVDSPISVIRDGDGVATDVVFDVSATIPSGTLDVGGAIRDGDVIKGSTSIKDGGETILISNRIAGTDSIVSLSPISETMGIENPVVQTAPPFTWGIFGGVDSDQVTIQGDEKIIIEFTQLGDAQNLAQRYRGTQGKMHYDVYDIANASGEDVLVYTTAQGDPIDFDVATAPDFQVEYRTVNPVFLTLNNVFRFEFYSADGNPVTVRGQDVSALSLPMPFGVGLLRSPVATADITTFVPYFETLFSFTENKQVALEEFAQPKAPAGFNVGIDGGWDSYVSVTSGNPYQWSDDTTNTAPQVGVVKVNNADESLANELYINPSNVNGNDITPIIENIAIGDRFSFRRTGSPANYAQYVVTSSPFDEGGYYSIAIAAESVNGGFLEGDEINFTYFPQGGRGITELDPTLYGDFNSINWASLPTGNYFMGALGNQIFNACNAYSFQPLSSYTFEIKLFNEDTEYGIRTVFTTDSDFSNDSIGRYAIRAGVDFGSSVYVGWRCYALLEDVGTQIMPLAPSEPSYGTGGVWGSQRDLSNAVKYRWLTDTSATDPMAQKLKGNNADLSLITELYIDTMTEGGFSIQDFLAQMQEDDFISINEFSDSSAAFLAKVTGDVTDNSGWFTVPVSVVDSIGSLPNNAEVDFIYVASSGRDASTTNYDNATSGLTATDTQGAIDEVSANVDALDIIEVEELLISSNFNNQLPAGTDTPLQIEFGAATGSGSDPVQLLADGTIQINETGSYTFNLVFSYGRIGSGGVSILHQVEKVNGVQNGRTFTQLLDDQRTAQTLSHTFDAGNLQAGDLITYEITRDSAGNNSGGLYTTPTTLPSIADTSSASIFITRKRIFRP